LTFDARRFGQSANQLKAGHFMMSGIVQDLRHYPVKGLAGQAMESVELAPRQGFPLDRVYGFARSGSGFDSRNPKPLPKTRFVVLARDAVLARLETWFDPETETLTITNASARHVFSVADDAGRAEASAFLTGFLNYPEDETPTLVSAAPHRFTDVSVVSEAMMNAVSLINRDSVDALATQVGQPIDPARFRGNIVFSGRAPFAELDWVGRDIAIGDVRMRVVRRTKRCPATQVNLETGIRDLDVPALIRQHHGHSDMGIYAEVHAGGRIRPGDAMDVL
jgi:MOSC domain-containing protein